MALREKEETKGYRCWVVTSRKPNRIRSWVAARRVDAEAEVKDAVRKNKTEGGVESRDPKRPFEATFSLVRGELVTTKFTD